MKKKPLPLAVRFVAGLTALVALGSALLAKVDPVNCLLRGAVAYIVGKSLAGLWCSLFPSQAVEYSGDSEPEDSGAGAAEDTERAAA